MKTIRNRRSFVQVIDEETGEKFMFATLAEAEAFIAESEKVEVKEEEDEFDFSYGHDLQL